MVRSELLEDGTITEDILALTILLDRSKCLKMYFSDFEQKQLKDKLKSIMDSPNGNLVKNMVSNFDTLFLIIDIFCAIF